ncbi:hypothetical protein [Yoonia sp. 208BN28-4]|uniref:hypothetical protein n=1 Tax=Yoonia sp. 208BN28-4 TaxID=3126505 RepID=UPI0030B472C6
MSSLAVPMIFLALMGWLVPKLLSMVMPEGVRPLMVLGLIATLLMFVISGIFFFGLYVAQGTPLAALFEPGIAPTILYFGHLGLTAAIVWAPILILSVASLPSGWTQETW